MSMLINVLDAHTNVSGEIGWNLAHILDTYLATYSEIFSQNGQLEKNLEPNVWVGLSFWDRLYTHLCLDELAKQKQLEESKKLQEQKLKDGELLF
jgi:hypothetical protein